MVDVVNLYVLKGDICPKCKILRNRCENSVYIKNFTDFKVIEIEPGDTEDTAYQLFIEKGINSMPVLQINNELRQFKEAMDFLNDVICCDKKCNDIKITSNIKFKIRKNDNVKDIEKALHDNGGYCPCKLTKTPETKCICKEFLDSNVEGNCHCGLYYKELV